MMKKYGALRERIRNQYGTQEAFARAAEMSISTLNGKLNGYSEWTISEIEKVCKLLDISMETAHGYFFYN